MRNIIKPFVLFAFITATSQAGTVFAVECKAKSGNNRVSLIELYTSEGCSSCPPADEWLSRLSEDSSVNNKIVPLSLHVDYWNYIGWRDPYSGPQYTQRQREIARRNNLNTMYTPQVVLNGQDFRTWHRQNITKTLDELNDRPALADLELSWQSDNASQTVNAVVTANLTKAAGSPGNEVLFLAVYENDIQSRVNAGENDGRVLKHDHVVREMYAMPFKDKTSVTQGVKLTLKPDWNRANLGIGIFVQDRNSGEILQALASNLSCDS